MLLQQCFFFEGISSSLVQGQPAWIPVLFFDLGPWHQYYPIVLYQSRRSSRPRPPTAAPLAREPLDLPWKGDRDLARPVIQSELLELHGRGGECPQRGIRGWGATARYKTVLSYQPSFLISASKFLSYITWTVLEGIFTISYPWIVYTLYPVVTPIGNHSMVRFLSSVNRYKL